MKSVLITDLGMSTAEVDIIKWKVKVGDSVKKGNELVDVESEKATLTIESPYSGIITKILCNEGEMVAVGNAICEIDDVD